MTTDNKAAEADNYKYSAIQLVGTDPLDRLISYSSYQLPEEMLKRVYGYSAICADKTASFLSTVPLRLYRRTSNTAQQATKDARSLSAARKKHILSTSGVGAKTALWAEQAGQVEEVVDSPLLKMLHKPNDSMLGMDFMYSLYWSRATTGNSYFFVEKDGRGNVTAMYVMLSQYVRPVLKDGILVGYSYGDRNAEVYNLEEIVHQKYRPSRYSSVYGECPLHSVLMAADILNAQNMRELCFQENNARPDFAIKVPSEASPQQMVDTENRFNSKMKGHRSSGKFITVKDSEIVPLGFSPKDLEGMNLRREMKQEILAAYGISESEFAMNDANLASSVSGNLQFYRNMKPLLIKNAEELTNYLVGLFYPDAEEGEYFLAYDEVLPEAAKPQLTPAEKINLGVMSINEMRAEMGLDPIEGGDRLRFNGQTLGDLDLMAGLNQLGNLPVEQPAEQPAEQAAAASNIADQLDNEEKTACTHCDDCQHKSLDLDEPLPPTNSDEYPSAQERVDERNNIWRKKMYCDHKTESKMARSEVVALGSMVRNLYLKFAKDFSVDASGNFDTQSFEGMMAAKLGEYLYSSLVRGNQDGQVRINRMKNKAAQPSLDVVPDRALEILANYSIQLARQITQNEIDELKKIIDTGMREGKSIGTITKEIKTLLNENATYKAERIARTETARAYVQGQSIAWQDAGIEKVMPILAPNSCTNCQDFVSKGAYGVDTPSTQRPPFHPSCRCDEEPVLPI